MRKLSRICSILIGPGWIMVMDYVAILRILVSFRIVTRSSMHFKSGNWQKGTWGRTNEKGQIEKCLYPPPLTILSPTGRPSICPIKLPQHNSGAYISVTHTNPSILYSSGLKFKVVSRILGSAIGKRIVLVVITIKPRAECCILSYYKEKILCLAYSMHCAGTVPLSWK